MCVGPSLGNKPFSLLCFQDSQCGTVIDVNIECAVKLVGTNCILYPVNSKDLQHIWVRTQPKCTGSQGLLVCRGAAALQVSLEGEASMLCKMHLQFGFILKTSLAEDDAASPHLPICSVFLITFLRPNFLEELD